MFDEKRANELEEAAKLAQELGDIDAELSAREAIHQMKSGLAVKLGQNIDDIPNPAGGGVAMYQNQLIPATTSAGPSFIDKVKGVGEAGLALGTGSTLGMMAGMVGAAHGIGKSMLNGNYGTQEAADAAQQESERTAANFTYAPRTETGKKYTQAVGEVVAPLADITPFTHELGIIGRSLKAAALNKDASAIIAPSKAEKYKYSPPALDTVSPEIKDKIMSVRPNIKPEEAARHIEAATLPVPVSLTEGQGMLDALKISKEMNSRGAKENLVKRYEDQNNKLKENLEAVKESSAPDIKHLSQADAGQHLVDSYKAVIGADKEKVDAAYQALRDATDGKFPVDGKRFAENAITILQDEDRLDYLPSVIAKKLKGYMDGDKEMNYNLFENMRTDLAAEIRKADRAGDGTAKYALSKVRDELENLPLSNESGAIKPLADNARMEAKAVFEKRNSDPAYSAVYDDDAKEGAHSALSDTFINRYVLKGSRSHAEKLVSQLESIPEAKQTLAHAVIDHLRSSGGVDIRNGSGNLSQAGYNKALTSLAPKLDILLDKPTADTLSQIGNVARYTQFQPKGSFVNNSNTAVAALASSAEHGTNMVFGGIPVGTVTRKAADILGARKSSNASLNPIGEKTVDAISESLKQRGVDSSITKLPEFKSLMLATTKKIALAPKYLAKLKQTTAYKNWHQSLSNQEAQDLVSMGLINYVTQTNDKDQSVKKGLGK